MAVEYITLSGTNSTNIGGVEMPGVVEVQETGGQQAPAKKIEDGYTWTTRVGAEPLEFTVYAWTTPEIYSRLTRLRDLRAPFSFSTGTSTIETAVLDDLSPTVAGNAPGSYDTTLQIRQVQQGSLGTEGIGGIMASGPQFSRGSRSPGLIQTGDFEVARAPSNQ